MYQPEIKFFFESERDYQMCISRKLKFLFEPERDYPRCISQNPSEIIIGVQIHDVLRVVFLRFYEAIFSSFTRALLRLHMRSTTSAARYFLCHQTRLHYVFTRASLPHFTRYFPM